MFLNLVHQSEDVTVVHVEGCPGAGHSMSFRRVELSRCGGIVVIPESAMRT